MVALSSIKFSYADVAEPEKARQTAIDKAD